MTGATVLVVLHAGFSAHQFAIALPDGVDAGRLDAANLSAVARVAGSRDDDVGHQTPGTRTIPDQVAAAHLGDSDRSSDEHRQYVVAAVTLTTVSKSSSRGSGFLVPPPMITQSCGRSSDCATAVPDLCRDHDGWAPNAMPG